MKNSNPTNFDVKRSNVFLELSKHVPFRVGLLSFLASLVSCLLSLGALHHTGRLDIKNEAQDQYVSKVKIIMVCCTL